MSTPRIPDNIPLNPKYGTGVFRRRIRLQGLAGRVVAELEDCNHGFRSTVLHDGDRVTAIHAEALRYPLNTCPGAIEPIQALVGTALTADDLSIQQAVNPRANCTHLYDLTLLAIHHALRGATTRQWDVTIPDEKDGPTLAEAALNGSPLLRWQVSNWVIQDRGATQGKTLHKGFSKWASALYQGDQRDAAFILQKGYFVSGARRFDIHKLEGLAVVEKTDMLGVCYSYSPGVVEAAHRTTGNVRDFSDNPEQLLTFR